MQNDTILTAEAEYSNSFSAQQKKFCLRLHYNGSNSFLFVNIIRIYQFKAKNLELNAYPLCLSNISKDFMVSNMKKTGLYGYLYDFSVDYHSIGVDILDILKYVMKKSII